MKELILRHYIATRKRGLITHYTSLQDFLDKMQEEIDEMNQADIYDHTIDGDMAQEAIDVVGVIFNMLHHFGFDVEAEFKANVNHQESRV
jgi:hypothetical protein